MAGGTANKALEIPFELAQDSTFPIVPFVSRKLNAYWSQASGRPGDVVPAHPNPKGLFDRIPDVNLLSGNFTQTAAVNYGQLVGAIAVAGGGQGVMFTLDPDYLPNATWVMRMTTLGILASITDTTGRPIFVPFSAELGRRTGQHGGRWLYQGTPDMSQGYRPAGPFLGFPVVVDQASPAVGNASIAKPGAAGDAFIQLWRSPQAYIVRRIQGRASRSSIPIRRWLSVRSGTSPPGRAWTPLFSKPKPTCCSVAGMRPNG